MVQIKRSQLLDNNLTGASLDSNLGFYDETANYTSGTVVSWKNKQYEALNSVTGTTEGDLTNAPDIATTDWKELVTDTVLYSVYPSSSQTFTGTRITVNFNTERQTDSNFSVASGEITFKKAGIYIISVTITNGISSGTSRSGSNVYVQLNTGSGYSDISNVLFSMYHRTSATAEDTGSITFPLTVSANNKIRIQTVRYNGTSTLVTLPAGCSISIFNNKGGKGDKGDQGNTGADGDMTWEGSWSAGTYNENQAVEYQGSSFVCNTNGTISNPGTPASPNTGWDLLAKKGTDGSGTSIVVADDGTNLANTPHSKLNFTGTLIGAADAGSGVANIYALPTKHKYMIPIWAEENAALGSGNYEWAYGNGANTGNSGGITIHVPSGYSCAVTAMSLRLGGGTATVELVKNGTLQGSNCNVAVSSGQGNTNTISSPISLSDGDYINFRTTTESGSSGPCVVTAWLTYTET